MTPIPSWLVKQWQLESLFELTASSLDVVIKFDHKYLGKISESQP